MQTELERKFCNCYPTKEGRHVPECDYTKENLRRRHWADLEVVVKALFAADSAKLKIKSQNCLERQQRVPKAKWESLDRHIYEWYASHIGTNPLIEPKPGIDNPLSRFGAKDIDEAIKIAGQSSPAPQVGAHYRLKASGRIVAICGIGDEGRVVHIGFDDGDGAIISWPELLKNAERI